MILSGKSIQKLGIISPHESRGVSHGLSYGEDYAGYSIRLAAPIMLEKNYLTLGVSLEYFCMPTNIIGRICDKSTNARQGILVQNTIIEPGWRGYLTLEISYVPLRDIICSSRYYHLFAGTPIAQVIFEEIDYHVEGYKGKYQDQPQTPVYAKLGHEHE